MVLDTPVIETQLEKLDFDTQAVDDFDFHEDVRLESTFEYEKEVVLDSEDESVCRNKVVGIPNGLSQFSVGSQGCGLTVERSDQQKDVPRLFTCNIGSEQSGESSQANALEIVDQFLSINKMEFSPGLDIKKTVKEKSLPDSSRKGPQNLAKSRAAPPAKIATFEWTDSDQHSKDDVLKTLFEFGGFRQISVMRQQKAGHRNSRGRGSGNEHGEKKVILNLHKKIAGSTHSDSRFIQHSPKETCGIEQVSNLNLENNCVEGFNEDMHAEPTEQELDAPDIFDVGFNTQIAAEAMEALSYGPSPGCIAFDAFNGPLNCTRDSLKDIARKAHSECASLPKSDCCNLGSSERKTMRRKRTARKRSGKNSNNQELDLELAIIKKVKRGKSLIGEQYNCMNFANSNESSGGRTMLMVQRQEDETVGRNNEQFENHPSSTISVEHIPLGKEQAEGELKSFSAVGQEIMQSSAGDTLKGSYDQSHNPGRRTDDGILKYRRKRSRLVADPTKIVSGRGRCSKLCADSSAEVRDSKLSQKELTALNSCLKLDTWSHPKGKRTLRKVQSRSKATNIYAPSTTFNSNAGKSYCIKNQRTTEDNDKTLCYSTETKGKVQSVHHISSLNSPEKESRKNFEPGSEVVISNSEPANKCKGYFAAEPDRTKAFMQSGKVNDMDCALFSNGVKKNHKFGVSTNKNLELPVSGDTTTNHNKPMNVASSNYVSSKYHKRPFKKNLPKSSLLKELIKLGGPESIPDSTWKDLRRRRDMSYVRVLFSQHLDDNIIKQQKKILVRLGISIATSPMDATHFIADRFVRTRNMLEAIALGKPVVTHLWLESCGQGRCLIDEKNHILRDAKKEKEIGFSMPVSFARARQYPLLEGQSVFITPNIKPPKEMINSLVKAVHGQVMERSQISAAEIQDNLLILSCEEDHAICVPFLDKGIAAYSSELLLNGIVIQKLELERHQLFKNHGKRIKPAQGKGKMSASKEICEGKDCLYTPYY